MSKNTLLVKLSGVIFYKIKLHHVLVNVGLTS